MGAFALSDVDIIGQGKKLSQNNIKAFFNPEESGGIPAF